MTHEQSQESQKKLENWQKAVMAFVAFVAFIAFAIIAQGTTRNDSSNAGKPNSPAVTIPKAPSVDIFTERACRKFREFVAEGSKGVLTDREMREQFRVSYDAAQFSEIPAIVNSATSTMAALTSGDVELFSVASNALAEACMAVGR
jgi:hypothetical protein